uniref:Uncharacterized protein n=1 Tax=Glossina austeni TaxID=7395 RepID=A0A1A9VVJ0_GLOAU
MAFRCAVNSRPVNGSDAGTLLSTGTVRSGQIKNPGFMIDNLLRRNVKKKKKRNLFTSLNSLQKKLTSVFGSTRSTIKCYCDCISTTGVMNVHFIGMTMAIEDTAYGFPKASDESIKLARPHIPTCIVPRRANRNRDNHPSSQQPLKYLQPDSCDADSTRVRRIQPAIPARTTDRDVYRSSAEYSNPLQSSSLHSTWMQLSMADLHRPTPS